jgi:hypothetical protein
VNEVTAFGFNKMCGMSSLPGRLRIITVRQVRYAVPTGKYLQTFRGHKEDTLPMKALRSFEKQVFSSGHIAVDLKLQQHR